MKKLFLVAFIGFMSCLGMLGNRAVAQMLDPAKLSYSVKETSSTEAELVVTVKLDAGWHMYSQFTSENGPLPTVFEFSKSSDYALVGKVSEPKPHEEMDEMFGCVVKSFSGTVVFRQKIKRLSQKDFTVKGVISYQLCNDGSCIAPEDHDITFKVKGALEETAADVKAVEDTAAVMLENSDNSENSENSEISEKTEKAENSEAPKEESESLLMIFLIALGGGILTMFTPCVFPMIPMTVNFFMHSSENKRKGRRQAWFFGLSIVLIFAVLGGILSAFLGPEQLNTIATNWIPNLIFFLIFFIFSLSFFGLFEIKMPEKWINSSDEQADKGGFLAPFFIALTTVLVSFSCTGPIIGGALVGLTTSSGADAETANRWVSLVTMLGFGIGFAAPFTLLAFFPQFLKNMKSGSWLNTVKVSFAFIELAFGLKFLQMADIDQNWGLLPRDIYLALWIVIFAMWGFYLLGKLRFKGDDPMEHVGTGRLMIAIVDFAFVVYMIPGLFGAKLEMLGGFLPPLSEQEFTVQKVVMEYGGGGSDSKTAQLPLTRKYHEHLKGHTPLGYETFYDLDEAKAYAQKVGKPIFIDFTGKNCANCRKMEENVWDKAKVKNMLTEHFVMVSLFCDENTIDLPEDEWITDDKGKVLKTLGKRNSYYQRSTFNMNAQPYYVIIDPQGRRLTENDYKYNTDPEQFVNWLNEGKNNYKK